MCMAHIQPIQNTQIGNTYHQKLKYKKLIREYEERVSDRRIHDKKMEI